MMARPRLRAPKIRALRAPASGKASGVTRSKLASRVVSRRHRIWAISVLEMPVVKRPDRPRAATTSPESCADQSPTYGGTQHEIAACMPGTSTLQDSALGYHEPDPHRWHALALVCVAFLMTVLDGTIVTVARQQAAVGADRVHDHVRRPSSARGEDGRPARSAPVVHDRGC